MKTLSHTSDSLKLAVFLKKHPRVWHSISNDVQTQRALARLLVVEPGYYGLIKYTGTAQSQLRLNGGISK